MEISKKYLKNMEFIEIEKIEKIEYLGEVVDLSVEDDNSYNIEGIIVHNSACTTYPATGFGSRNCQASVVLECSSVSKVPIIADGGIKEPGDISKSLVMGASMVMIGGMLSGYDDSPGHKIFIDGKYFKEFWGSASQHQSNKTNRIEGKKILVEYKDRSLLDGYQYLKECLQSAISYGGGKDLSCFNSVKWITHTK